MRSAARRLDMALAAHAAGCHASPRGSLATPPRVGGRGRWVESPSQRWSIRRRAFSSDAPATSPDAPPPVTHLLTAYDMNAAPAMQVTPLRLAGTGAERHGELGSRLWRAIRLARDVRREGTGVVSVPELFAPAPRSWGEGVALRLGARGAVTDAVEASLKAENDAFALVEEPARALDEALVRSHPENRAAYAAVLREALYAHAAEVAFTSRGFEVSRTRDHGVRFVETTTTTTSTSAAVVFETAIDVDDGGAARLVASTRALAPRSKRTVRDLLDDPSFVLRSGLELVALGGPSLEGTLLLEGDEGAPDAGAVGAPRAELGGESLLEYHRKRYPARVELLRGADPSARAVWLVPGTGSRARARSRGDDAKAQKTRHAFGAFGGPMAYPAELLAPRRLLPEDESSDFLSSEPETTDDPPNAPGGKFSGPSSSRDRPGKFLYPGNVQERVTRFRTALGQPFVRHFGRDVLIAEKMTRLPEPIRVSSGPCGKLVGKGSVASGPAIAPRFDVETPKLVLVPIACLRGTTRSDIHPDEASSAMSKKEAFRETVDALRERIGDGVAAAHEAWSVPVAATRATRDDVRGADVVASLSGTDEKETGVSSDRLSRTLKRCATNGADRVVVETGGDERLEKIVRDACFSARLPPPRRCFFDTSARELALELGATRGGQAFTFPGFAAAKPNLLAGLDGQSKEPSGTPSGTVFVGVSGVSGVARRGGERADEAVVAVVDENAAVLFDGARARRLRLRRSERRFSEEDKREEDKSEEESDEDDEDGENEGSASFSASYADASRLAGAAAASAALEAYETGTPKRLVAHYDGKSHPFFREAFVSTASERGVLVTDVVDVEREPWSVTGRVLRWDKKNGVDAPDRGVTFALTETRAVAITAGDAPGRGDGEGPKFLARPLFLRRVAGATDALTIAREVVALAETRVDGFGGAHAMPVTLRGGGRQTRVVMV